MGAYLRKYGVATASGSHIGIPMVKAASRDFATSSDWTPAAGDVKVSIDGGTEANIATLPTYTNGSWIFQLSAGELTGKTTRVKVVDSATKAVEDQFFDVETYGHTSALHPFDLSLTMADQSFPEMTIESSSYADFDTAVAAIIAACEALPALHEGTAQAGGNTSITLADGATATANFYQGAGVLIESGTGAGQDIRIIRSTDGSNPNAVVATVMPQWVTNPDNTSVYKVIAAGGYLSNLLRKFMFNRKGVESDGTITLYDDDGTTPFLTWAGTDDGTDLNVAAAT